MTDLSPGAVERLAVMLDHDDKRHQTTGSRAAATLRAQAAEIGRLRAALRPFGEYGFDGPNGLSGFDLDYQGRPLPDDEGVGWVYLTHGDFRRARAALPIPDREGA